MRVNYIVGVNYQKPVDSGPGFGGGGNLYANVAYMRGYKVAHWA